MRWDQEKMFIPTCVCEIAAMALYGFVSGDKSTPKVHFEQKIEIWYTRQGEQTHCMF